MPARIPVHRPTPQTRAPASWGNGRGGRPWRRLRDQVLKRDRYLCQACLREGQVTPGTEVDHRIPVAAGGTDDLSNLQLLCSPCHQMKTASEAAPGDAASFLPHWMPRPVKPLIVVVGPPASGKSTHVREHAGPEDLVLDLEDIARQMKSDLYAMDPAALPIVVRLRNERLASFCRGRTAHPRCWMIASSGTFKQRKFWQDIGAQIVEVNPGSVVCRQRVQAQAMPEAARLQRLVAIDRWN